ncbi:Strubbelig-receptor family [Thalictrum thalictroides]|uniref:Strubbelig-receptor family n=1 Tax=Thalictrum thalictroides TaxID=46969 RepID=A0A7J6VU51_THATH|nr:Strubbelig-receptor family [Thalictrum thalictroides]
MAKASSALLLCLSLLFFSALADTDPNDVLKHMYITLNQSIQLIGWHLNGGDPCGKPSWKGIYCDGQSIVQIKLSGLDLFGRLEGRFDLQNLKHLDLSSNRIQGDIPFLLPPNATHIDLSSNQFSGSLPYALTFLKHLGYLNLSHNALYGELGNIFGGLPSLVLMDLAYNHLSGDLPLSFGDLNNLTSLYLQNNSFSGSVSILANIPLTDLFIQNNHFSGELPYQFLFLYNFWYSGNDFLKNSNVEENSSQLLRRHGDYESGILLVDGKDFQRSVPSTLEPTDAAFERLRLATHDFSQVRFLRTERDYGLEHLTWVDRVELSYMIALELQKLHVDDTGILDDGCTVSYTFGMFLFELLTGKHTLVRSIAEVDPFIYLTDHSKDIRHIVDHNMKGTHTRGMIRDMRTFGDMLWRCIQAEPDLRPTMSEIVESLKDLRVPKN